MSQIARKLSQTCDLRHSLFAPVVGTRFFQHISSVYGEASRCSDDSIYPISHLLFMQKKVLFLHLLKKSIMCNKGAIDFFKQKKSTFLPSSTMY